MKYAIISTWNGEGYSLSNTAVVKEFDSDFDALLHIIDLAKEYKDDFEFTTIQKIGEGVLSYDNIVDQGTFQFHMLEDDAYGVVIQCNVNEADIMTKKAYETTLKMAIKQADKEELEETDLTANEIYIGAYKEDYDYQFIKF